MGNFYTFGVAMFAAIGTFLFVGSPSRRVTLAELGTDVFRASTRG